MRGLAGVVAIVIAASTARADVELHSDGFLPGDVVGFNANFAMNEVAAVRFVAPDPGRQLNKVRLLYGGTGMAMTQIGIQVWDDTAGTDIPGTSLTALMVTIETSDTALVDVDLTTAHVALPMQFRVGMIFRVGSPPTLAHDEDGVHLDTNFIMDKDGTWHQGQSEGLTGDWILRAVVSGDAMSRIDTAVADGGTNGCGANPDCPLGQYCDLDHLTCTFDCRSGDDCASGHCSSLGQCVGESGDGDGGCCQTNGGSSTPAIVMMVFWLMSRRTRRELRSNQH